MEEPGIADRAALCALLQTHPEWTLAHLADYLGRSVRWVKRWRRRLEPAAPNAPAVLRSQSRRAHATSSTRSLWRGLRTYGQSACERVAGSRAARAGGSVGMMDTGVSAACSMLTRRSWLLIGCPAGTPVRSMIRALNPGFLATSQLWSSTSRYNSRIYVPEPVADRSRIFRKSQAGTVSCSSVIVRGLMRVNVRSG